jgi:branched-chain amino acid transport system ATP-binding protein
LLDVISGLNPASAGTITFDGDDITRLKPERICHRGIARTFQLNAGFDTLTVRENVAVGAGFGGGDIGLARLSSGRQAEQRIEQALQVVGLEAKADLVVGGLAVLDRKLLMLASALATDPKLLLIDEPVGGLNPSEIDQVMEIVARVLELGVTILLIEHVMRFLLRLSTRVVIMHHGETIYDGLPGGLVRDERVVDVYLGEGTAARLQNFLESDRGDGHSTATH